MVMDTIKKEFIGSVRPYRDRPDISVPVRWYRANPTANFMPYPFAFANINTWDHRFRPNVGINREFHPGEWGNVGGYLGKRPIGDAGSWLNGVSYPVQPCDCPREPLLPIQEIPVGVVDGTNRVFTLSHLPLSNMATTIFVGGLVQTQAVDYSLVNQTVTFAPGSTPTVGSNVLAWYWIPT